jgi:hypothetical protein
MEKDTLLKIIGILVVVALAGSMIAVAFNYTQDTPTAETDLDTVNQEQTQSFDYTITFDTNVLSELSAIRIALQTTELSKQEIDQTIGKLSGVSRVRSSEFRNLSDGWYYFAEIDLKKNTIITDAVQEIKDLNYFDGMEEVMKRVSINTALQTIKVHNADNNITRNFDFDYATTFATVSLDTMPGDKITVSGSITLQGKTILSLELIEGTNQTAQVKTFMTQKEFEVISVEEELFFEAKLDGNVDQNYYDDLLSEIDANMQKFYYNNSYVGQTTKANMTLIKEVFSAANTLTLKQNGKIFLDKTYVADINKEFDINSEVNIELLADTKVNDTVLAELTIYVERDELVDIVAVEKE